MGSPLDVEVINARVDTLKSMGFNVVLGDYVYSRNGFLAGSDQERASDLMKMFENPQVNMILPSRGGVGVAGILPYLDYHLIHNNPKIITGYSDITILLNVLYQQANLITFQSLLLIDFRPDTPAYNFNQFFFRYVFLFFLSAHSKSPGNPLNQQSAGQCDRSSRRRQSDIVCRYVGHTF